MDFKSTKYKTMYLFFLTFIFIIEFPFQGRHIYLYDKYGLNALNNNNNND